MDLRKLADERTVYLEGEVQRLREEIVILKKKHTESLKTQRQRLRSEALKYLQEEVARAARQAESLEIGKLKEEITALRQQRDALGSRSGVIQYKINQVIKLCNHLRESTKDIATEAVIASRALTESLDRIRPSPEEREAYIDDLMRQELKSAPANSSPSPAPPTASPADPAR